MRRKLRCRGIALLMSLPMCIVILTSLCRPIMVSGKEVPNPLLAAMDTSSINGDGFGEGTSGGDDIGEEIPLETSLSHPTIASPDTLRTYTLSGQRIYGKAKVSRTRTPYSIIIMNGRKVLKR